MKYFIGLLFSFSCHASYVIPNGSVFTAKLANNAVTTAKIANGAVTQITRAALNIVTSSSSGTFTGTSGSAANVTNLSISITTTGRPVELCIIPDGTSAVSGFSIFGSGGAWTTVSVGLFLVRTTTTIASFYGSSIVNGNGSNTLGAAFPVGMCHIDVPSAGTYTYKVQYDTAGASGSGTLTASVTNVVLTAFEL